MDPRGVEGELRNNYDKNTLYKILKRSNKIFLNGKDI